jgi:hypothetical protein
MLYLVNVLGYVKHTFTTIPLVIVGITFMGIVIYTLETNGKDFSKNLKRLGIPVLLVFGLIFMVGVLIPGEKTRYAILASELGEEALQQQVTQEYLDKIKQIIDTQIDGWVRKDNP